MTTLTLSALHRLDRTGFITALGEIFEHSPWVAEGAWSARPFANSEQLHAVMVQVMQDAGLERQLALIQAHPDLAGKAAARGELTASSTHEQASAGLDRCTPEELIRVQDLNRAYKDKFGFPFIMAVKGQSRHKILAAFADRLNNSPEAEFDQALAEIAKIAHLRLTDLLQE